MKRLFFNSALVLLLLLFTFCASNKNNPSEIQQTIEQSNTTKQEKDSVKTAEPKVQKGASMPSQSADTASSKKGSHYNNYGSCLLIRASNMPTGAVHIEEPRIQLHLYID